MRKIWAALAVALTLLLPSLSQPATANGRALVTGVLLDGLGNPIGGATIGFGSQFGLGPTTAADGSYSVEVPTGTYPVTIFALFDNGPEKYYTLGGAIVAVTGDRVADFTVPRVVPLNVTLRHPDGSPAANTQIETPFSETPTAVAHGNNVRWQGFPYRFTSSPPLLTDGAGRITVPAMLGSTTTIQDRIRNRFPTKSTVTVHSDPTNATVTLPRADRLHGVLADTSGRPVPNASVSLRRDGTFADARTASDGSYEFHAAPGSYAMESSFSDFPARGFSTSVAGTVEISGDDELNVTLPVSATLRVRLRNGDGSPATDASVLRTTSAATLATSAGTPMTLTSTYGTTALPDAEGLATTMALLGSTATVDVQVPGRGTVTGVTEVPTDPTDTTVTIASASAVVSGVVRNDEGDPLSGASVQVLSLDSNTAATTSTSADGSWSAAVVPGEVRLTVQHRGTTGPGATPYGVSAVGTFDVLVAAAQDVELPTPELLTTRVLDAGKDPVPDVSVFFASSRLSRTTGGVDFDIFGPASTEARSNSTGDLPLLTLRGSTVEGVLRQSDDFTTPFSFEVPTTGTPGEITLAWFGSVPSQGSDAGKVTITGPTDATLTELASQPATSTPDGHTALVGDVSYEVSDIAPGSTVNVTLTLPEGSKPTSVFKVDAAGATTDATSHATITGNTIVLQLTDGGFGDADGTANGVIVDPVIPTSAVVEPEPEPEPPVVEITTSTLPSGRIGKLYSTRLAATPTAAGPVTWSLAGGSLPAGVVLQKNGVLAGRPILARTSTFTLRATDSARKSATRRFTVKVVSGPLQTVSLRAGRVGKRYLEPIQIWGVSPRQWRLASGRLPRGLAISSRGNLQGKPRAAGTWSFVLLLKSSTASGPVTKVRVRVVIRRR